MLVRNVRRILADAGKNTQLMSNQDSETRKTFNNYSCEGSQSENTNWPPRCVCVCVCWQSDRCPAFREATGAADNTPTQSHTLISNVTETDGPAL